MIKRVDKTGIIFYIKYMQLREADITYDTAYWWVTGIQRKSNKGPIIDERWSEKDEAINSFKEHKKRILADSTKVIDDTEDSLVTDKYILDFLWIDSINNKIKELNG
ncbi:MAG: hypothetical protein IK038_13255 [Bacteroidaceae bacterium]|nr:hypothetical protein [Bacteroidaceae bacterium]